MRRFCLSRETLVRRAGAPPAVLRSVFGMLGCLAALGLLGTGCGGSGGGSAGVGSGGQTSANGSPFGNLSGGSGGASVSKGPLLSYANRNAVISGTANYLNNLQAQPPAQREAAAMAYLAKQPGVAAVGSSHPGAFWARFTDGVYWVMDETLLSNGNTPSKAAVMPSKPTSAAPTLSRSTAALPAAPPLRTSVSTRSVAPPVTSPVSPTRDAASQDLPASNQALLLDTLPKVGVKGFYNSYAGSAGAVTARLQQMLTKRGYQVQNIDPSVDNLKTAVNNIAFLHWATHGALVNDQAGNNKFWGALTTTPDTQATEAAYQGDLTSDRLVIYTAATQENVLSAPVYSTNLAVTSNFITQYGWSFAKNGFAWINCCWSDADGFTATLRSLPSPAGFTAGWSNAADPLAAWASASYIVDRMLGSNLDTNPESPPQRPFDSDSIFAEASQAGMTTASTTTYGPCSLTLTSGVLAPSISYMTVLERAQDSPNVGTPTLTINGIFGSVQGTVQVGGNSVSVQSWSSTQIKCDLPNADNSNGAGDVQVITKANIKSNMVPLTVWQGTVTYNVTNVPGTYLQTAQVTDNVYIRADIHQYRTTPGTTPKAQPSIYFRAAPPSTCNWNIQWNLPPYTSWITNTGTLPYGDQTNAGPIVNGVHLGYGFIFEGDMEPDQKTVNVGWAFFGAEGEVLEQPPMAPSNTGNVSIFASVDAKLFAVANTTPSNQDPAVHWTHPVATTFASNWGIGSVNLNGDFYTAFKNTLQWPAIAASSAPDSSNGEDDTPN